jgi:cell division transport system permease protein
MPFIDSKITVPVTPAQKEEIKALFIFGATNSFICRPYVWRGCITMTLSSITSLLITLAGIRLLAEPVENFAKLYGAHLALTMPSLEWCLLFVAGAGLVGAVIGGIAARDSLRSLRQPL